jgi:hypothetical protein
MRRRRTLLALAVLAPAVLLWALPSDVPKLIARQDDVLLGRYSEARLVAAALVTVLALPASILLWRGVGALEVLVRAALALGGAGLAFAAASIASYAPAKQRYLETPVAELAPDAPVERIGATRRRQPGRRFEMLRADVPRPARSYPNAPAGFPEARILLTTDADGFRNPEPADAYAIVVAGDSFSEGSMVSDSEVWSARLGEALGVRVHNVAMSGASPRNVLNNLIAFGRAGSPRLAVVSVYEGNDFKEHRDPPAALAGSSADGRPAWRERLAAWRSLAFKESPLRARLKGWLIGTFGPVNRDAPVAPHPGLRSMPVAIEARGSRAHYAFEPRELLRLLVRRERFEKSGAWTQNAAVFREIAAWAKAEGMELVFLYAPAKPRVVMPLVRDRVSAEDLRAFLAFADRELPPADRLAAQIDAELDTIESVFLDFCRSESLRCWSLTERLRRETAEGSQVYFSYDPHWTRLGHEAVAAEVASQIGPQRAVGSASVSAGRPRAR